MATQDDQDMQREENVQAQPDQDEQDLDDMGGTQQREQEFDENSL
jgi:hypothetical protein